MRFDTVWADKRTLAGHRRSHFGLLSHFESIVYLGIEVDDALEISEQTEI